MLGQSIFWICLLLQMSRWNCFPYPWIWMYTPWMSRGCLNQTIKQLEIKIPLLVKLSTHAWFLRFISKHFKAGVLIGRCAKFSYLYSTEYQYMCFLISMHWAVVSKTLKVFATIYSKSSEMLHLKPMCHLPISTPSLKEPSTTLMHQLSFLCIAWWETYIK